jgi:hypothetical protein
MKRPYDLSASDSADESVRMQNILGDFNDTEVQLVLIKEFVDHGTITAEKLVATKSLTGEFTERQRKLRADFAERFPLFASDENRKLYKRTFRR